MLSIGQTAKANVAERLALPQARRSLGWLVAVVRTARPRQWPKNLLVFAAPLASATLGRPNGLGYALVATAGFGCASVAVYFINDVVDAERDRDHPRKRFRPVAAARHRPVMRWYRPAALRVSQWIIGALMIAAYLAWAFGEHPGARGWHLLSAIPLAAALVRFGVLTSARHTAAPVEELLTRDIPMLVCELAWLALFVAGL